MMPYTVSVTRLRLRSIRFLLPFIRDTLSSARQARKATGNLGLLLRKTKGLTFWTLSLWENLEAMQVYRGGTPHRAAMTKLPQWCDEASVAHWQQEEQALPSWEMAAKQLQTIGHLSRVKHPSPDQQAGRIMTT